MTIERDGKLIDLTVDELTKAYYEQEHNFDVQDVQEHIEGYDDETIFGYTFRNHAVSVDKARLLELVDDIATEERRLINKWGLRWYDAIDQAIENVLRREAVCNESRL